jgi:hypothetical protein
MSIGEESMAKGQLKLVVEKMHSWGEDKLLFVYDRGYPSKDFMLSHLSLRADLLFRIPTGFNKKIDDFVASGKKDGVLKLYDEAPDLRIAVYSLSSGEQEVLLTNLVDGVEVTYNEAIFPIWGSMESDGRRV